MNMQQILFLIKDIQEDSMCPRNVRNTLEEAKKCLSDEKQETAVKVSSAVYLVQKLTEDPNIPSHVRIKIYNLLSALESVK
jgi:hypothetical protein